MLDGAGVLTHQERLELLHTLEDLERNISPVALCIYLTDHGKAQDLRTHAHWILNHARIHHPSFGKREQRKAIEDAALEERLPGEKRPHYADVSPGLLERLWTSVKTYIRDAWHPLPPPVRQEWMLMLVVDVSLEMACFSWGYKLDPYVNPDSINSCIISARLQFRERDMVSGLKKVMRAAVNRIAVDARKVNKRLRRSASLPKGIRAMLLGALLLGLSLPAAAAAPARPANNKKPAAASSANTRKPATKPTAAKPAPSKPKPAPRPAVKPTAPPPTPAPPPPTPALADDDIAEEVEDSAEEVTPADAAPTPAETPAAPAEAPAPAAAPTPAAEPAPESAGDKGASASYSAAPRWQTEHYRLLMAGELDTGYNALFPAEAPAADTAKSPAAKGTTAKTEESDRQIPSRYCDAYLHPDSNVTLCDPQKLLSSPESLDATHVLRSINNDTRYRICVAVVQGTQEVPAEMHASTLVQAVAQPFCDHAALVLYPLGRPDAIDIGYRDIDMDDTKRHEWLLAVREAALAAGGGAEGLMAAARTLDTFIRPLSSGFRVSNPEATEKAPHIVVELKPKEPKKISAMEKFRKMMEDPENRSLLIIPAVLAVLIILALIWFFFLRRHVAVLLDTDADIRLGSPYGAGVSRQVRYLEGVESAKEKTLF